jgi:hypothetical protein
MLKQSPHVYQVNLLEDSYLRSLALTVSLCQEFIIVFFLFSELILLCSFLLVS